MLARKLGGIASSGLRKFGRLSAKSQNRIARSGIESVDVESKGEYQVDDNDRRTTHRRPPSERTRKDKSISDRSTISDNNKLSDSFYSENSGVLSKYNLDASPIRKFVPELGNFPNPRKADRNRRSSPRELHEVNAHYSDDVSESMKTLLGDFKPPKTSEQHSPSTRKQSGSAEEFRADENDTDSELDTQVLR